MIAVSCILTAVGVYGAWQITIEFDFLKFLPKESNLYLWYSANKEYFPVEGFRGNIYFAESDLQV